MKSRFLYIAVAILLMMIVSPFIRYTGQIGHLLTAILAVMIPLTSLYALTADRNQTITIILLAAPLVILDALSVLLSNRVMMIAAYIFATALYLYIIVLLVKTLLSQRKITADLIYCAISTYFLIGIMWSCVYVVIESISPGAFSGVQDRSDLLYFSFVTLTTVGFGDITPQSIIAKRVAVIEAAMGGIYLAVIIAMLVGRYMTMAED